MIARELQNIANDLKVGNPVEPVTVRTFLSWFSVQRRGPNIVRRIRSELEEAGLVTVPDFESRWVDSEIEFDLLDNIPAQQELTDREEELEREESESKDETIAWVTRDATYRISKLAAANQKIVSINPNAPLSEAVTLLLARDFSQLPVMTSEHTVKGMISWRSIGFHLALGITHGTVQEFMEPHHEVRAEISIFDAIPLISQNDYVLVRGEKSQITGIVTASDLSLQFQTLSEPFLLLSEIENLMRNMIGRKFSLGEILSAVNPEDAQRRVSSVDDLNFGEYVRLLQNEARWSQLRLPIDRVLFCKDLDTVREIRNDITHFDPDGITSDELNKLRAFKSFLGKLETISK